MILADRIRHFVQTETIDPARQRGEKTIRVSARDVHQKMGLDNRLPAVCEALDADKFLEFAKVTLVGRSGPHLGSSAEWVFGL